MSGSDPSSMKRLALRLRSGQSSVLSCSDSLMGQLAALDWHGDAADRFQSVQVRSLDQERDQAANHLARLAERVDGKAERQRQASLADGAGVGGGISNPQLHGSGGGAEMERLLRYLQFAGDTNELEGLRQLGVGLYESVGELTPSMLERTRGSAPWIDSLVLAPQAVYYGFKNGIWDASSVEHSLDLAGTWGSWAAGGPVGGTAWSLSHGGTKYLLEETQWGRDAVDGMVLSTESGAHLESISQKLARGETLSSKEMDYIDWKASWGAAIFWK